MLQASKSTSAAACTALSEEQSDLCSLSSRQSVGAQTKQSV